MQGGAPHAGCCDLCWARSRSSHPPTTAWKEEIPWEKTRKIDVPDKKYRQNNVSNYKVAFFSPQRLGEIPGELLPSGLQSLCAGQFKEAAV